VTAYELRSARSDDIVSVLQFWRDHAEDTNRRDDQAAVEALLRRDADALVLATEDSHILGTLIAGWDGWRCHLYRVAVRCDRRRGGIARIWSLMPRRGSLHSARTA
jgi:ribosomal protein S18 acetylase RimI-like enzyme